MYFRTFWTWPSFYFFQISTWEWFTTSAE